MRSLIAMTLLDIPASSVDQLYLEVPQWEKQGNNPTNNLNIPNDPMYIYIISVVLHVSSPNNPNSPDNLSIYR